MRAEVTQSTRIPGVRFLRIPVHADERGHFAETFRAEWFPDFKAVQHNESRSAAGVFRGMHWHRRQTDMWQCSDGAVQYVLQDVRSGSGSGIEVGLLLPAGATANRHLWRDVVHGILIPPGVVHGYHAEVSSTVRYAVDRYYDPKDEYSAHWSSMRDHIVGMADMSPILSERDANAPTLARIEATTPELLWF